MRAALRVVVPVLVAGALAAGFVAVAPSLPVESAGLQDLSAVAFTASLALASLVLSSVVALEARVALVSGVVGGAILGWIYYQGLEGALVGPQVLALLLLGRALGGLVGDRVTHPGHIMPSLAIAAGADFASVLAPEGVSNAILESPRALSVFALASAIPGTDAVTLVLGIGDLIIMSMVLSVARKFEVPRRRVVLALALALALAFGAAFALALPVPALVPIALVCIALVPQFRRLERKDRTVGTVAIAVSIGIVLVVAVRGYLGRG
jgi:hypothetical protein